MAVCFSFLIKGYCGMQTTIRHVHSNCNGDGVSCWEQDCSSWPCSTKLHV